MTYRALCSDRSTCSSAAAAAARMVTSPAAPACANNRMYRHQP